MTTRSLRFSLLIAILGFPALTAFAAESDTPAISLDKLALELSNPVTALRQFDMDFTGTEFQGDLPGADGLSSMRSVLTPSWPFKLKNGNNILISLNIPINSDQPLWELAWWDHTAQWRVRQRPDMHVDRGFWALGHDHLDDISINIGYGGVSDSGFIGMVGLSATIPTSEDGTSERDQTLLGPEFVLGRVTDWGLYGAKFKHMTDVYEDDVPGGYGAEFPWSTNETTADIFFAYALGNGWQIESNPTILYDWEAVSGNEWTVPIGGGVSKTLRIGRVPVKFAVEIHKFIVSPDRFGPDWQLTFRMVPVLSSKLLR